MLVAGEQIEARHEFGARRDGLRGHGRHRRGNAAALRPGRAFIETRAAVPTRGRAARDGERDAVLRWAARWGSSWAASVFLLFTRTRRRFRRTRAAATLFVFLRAGVINRFWMSSTRERKSRRLDGVKGQPGRREPVCAGLHIVTVLGLVAEPLGRPLGRAKMLVSTRR